MTATQVASRFHDDVQRTAAAAAAAVSALWRQIDDANIIESWSALLDPALDQVERAQLAAAVRGTRYVDDVVRAQGVSPAPAGRVNAAAMAGTASDGRPLATLLALPAHQTVGRISGGQSGEAAVASGRYQLMMFAATQVQDAGRMSASVGMTADRQLGGYRRQLTPPSCSRCAVLAGRWYRWNEGFLRHPNCDCVHVPGIGRSVDVAGLETFDPAAYFDSLEEGEQDRIFTQAGARAIRDGADVGQVVNARRGMRTAIDPRYGRRVSTTLEGTTARASAGRLLRERPTTFGRDVEVRPGLSRRIAARPMPEEIYRAADGNRDAAISALARWGYLT